MTTFSTGPMAVHSSYIIYIYTINYYDTDKKKSHQIGKAFILERHHRWMYIHNNSENAEM